MAFTFLLEKVPLAFLKDELHRIFSLSQIELMEFQIQIEREKCNKSLKEISL